MAIHVCRKAFTSNIYLKHAAAHHNQPVTKQENKYVMTRARQRRQADRVGEGQHVVEHLQLCPQHERRKICPLTTNKMQHYCCTVLSLSPFSFVQRAASGYRVTVLEHGVLGSYWQIFNNLVIDLFVRSIRVRALINSSDLHSSGCTY